MARAIRWLLGAALVAAGCTLVTEFWADDDSTPVQAFAAPSGYERSGFGTVVAAVEMDLGPGAGPTTLVAASAGLGSRTETYHWATLNGLESSPHISSVCSPLSGPVDDIDAETWGTCEDSGSGGTLLWVPSFRFPGESVACPGALLVGQPLAGEFDAGRVAVHCTSSERTVGLDRGPGGSARFGRALALIPSAAGARVAVGAVGAVWVTAGPVEPSAVFQQAALAGINTESFGLALAGGSTADGLAYLAVGASTLDQTDEQPSRIVLFRTDPSSTEPEMFRAAACLQEAAHSPLGSSLLTFDFDDDGNDELVYRASDGAVHVADGAAIAALDGAGGDPSPCDFDAPVGEPIVCPAESEFGVECSDRFGAALAAGDINLDGSDELLVGDPGAKVSGKDRAGAVHVFEQGATGWERTGALFDADTGAGQRMGTSIAVAPVDGRPEPFVGSAGSSEVFVFYCSGIEGDKPRADDPANPGHRLDDRCRGQ